MTSNNTSSTTRIPCQGCKAMKTPSALRTRSGDYSEEVCLCQKCFRREHSAGERRPKTLRADDDVENVGAKVQRLGQQSPQGFTVCGMQEQDTPSGTALKQHVSESGVNAASHGSPLLPEPISLEKSFAEVLKKSVPPNSGHSNQGHGYAKRPAAPSLPPRKVSEERAAPRGQWTL